MSSLRTLIARLAALFSPEVNDDHRLNSEFQAHLDLLIEEHIRRGMTPEAARHAARREFGGLEQIKASYRDQRGFPFVDALVQDIRFAFRMLAKSPGFAAAAILTLALGIGANTVIFSAVNAILLQPLPYANPSKLVLVRGFHRYAGVETTTSFSASTWEQIRRQSPLIEQMGLYSSQRLTLTGGGSPEELAVAFVSGSFFPTLGIAPAIGRPLLDVDTKPGNTDVAVLSYSLWRDAFGGDPNILNREIALNEKPYRVVGVMPARFEFAASKRGIWLPFAVKTGDEAIGEAVARLRTGVTIKQVNAQLAPLGARIMEHANSKMKWILVAAGIKDDMVGLIREGLLILWSAVGFVLLIACVNVSGLLLARSWTRQREVAIRTALGATRTRIVRQFLAESILLSLTGGSLGLLLAVWGVRALHLLAPVDTPRLDELKLDPAVLCFTFAVAILAGIAFGLVPALQISKQGPGESLKDSAGGASVTAARKTHRLRSALVVAEVALAVILVVSASLMVRSFVRMTSVDLGFRTDHILTMTAGLTKSICDEQKPQGCVRSADAILRGIQGLPGIQHAAVASNLPVDQIPLVMGLKFDGKPTEVGFEQSVFISYHTISSGYFQTMGLRLLAGRAFDDTDGDGAPKVAIVNEIFAKQFFPQGALGHRIALPRKDKPDAWMQIVGEVAASHDSQLDHKPLPEYYIPIKQAEYWPATHLVIRTASDPLAVATAVQQQVWAVDKNAPITAVETMDQVVYGTLAEPRFYTILLGGFGALGFVMAMLGIYGVISYAVTQRTHEIGVRMALGARPENVLRMVIGEGMVLAAIGVIIGIGGSLAVTKFLNSLLYDTKPTDPLTFTCVAVALTLTALFACYIPARRATRIDPLVALRYE